MLLLAIVEARQRLPDEIIDRPRESLRGEGEREGRERERISQTAA